MSTFRPPTPDLTALLDDVLSTHHQRLANHGVRIGLRMAFAAEDKDGNPKGAALMHHGYPALALVRIVSHKDRVAGLPDAIIDVDGDRWPEQSDEEKIATLDHELTHLVPILARGGAVKLDDCHRPRLKMRKHDWQLGGFAEVVERHGVNAIEAQEFEKVSRKFRQMELFADADAA